MPETARQNGAESLQILDVLKNYVAAVQESVPVIEKRVTETRAAVQSEVSKMLARAAKTEVAVNTNARAAELKRDLEKRITRARDAILDALGIATKSEVGALSRKVNKLAKAVSSNDE